MRSLSTKLILCIGAALALIFVILEYAHTRLTRRTLERDAVSQAEGMADVIQRSTRYSMLRNAREDVYQIIRSIGVQPVVRRIRIYNKAGRINYSTDEGELNTQVDLRAEACWGCHASSQPLEKLPGPDRARVYRLAGERVVGVIRPIENEAACSGAPCHAHAPSLRVLGVLDVVVSLEPAEQAIQSHERRIAVLTLLGGTSLLLLLSALVVHMVRRPVQRLTEGANQLAQGNLGYRLELDRTDEIGRLGRAFDHMAAELQQTHNEIERRVEEKTAELERTQQKLLHSEKLASLGQMAAAVAHEINNPLAGILTYAKLAQKRFPGNGEVREWLEVIQRESKRCGQIVGNLLAFSRNRPVEIAPARVEAIFERALAVTRHKLELQQIRLETTVAPGLPEVPCDASQIEQVLVSLVINALEATPAGGRVRLAAARAGPEHVEIAVSDDGAPIPAEVLPHIFEPFFTTKTQSSGAGLGLAVAYGIVRRHGGEILVETGPETTFRIRLPVERSTP
jgi:two-component system NtrC family sensor kinase